MIQIIDYKSGNIRSVENALNKLNQQYEVIDSPDKLKDNAKVIFPGVGAAGSAMKILKEKDFDKAIPKIKTPFLGICLGMQLLLENSEEDNAKCLGIIKGNVKKFPNSVKTPQIGWNKVQQTKADSLFMDIYDDNYFYFVNSYYTDVGNQNVLGRTDYGSSFASVIKKDNFYGVQFHPEKSGDIGFKLLNNFCKLC
ncbi:imidazole glycerol phosphate synthase subunit HisH [Patescibacteria group bacterium]